MNSEVWLALYVLSNKMCNELIRFAKSHDVVQCNVPIAHVEYGMHKVDNN